MIQFPIAAVADTAVIDVNPDLPNLTLQLYGTFAGINCAFEAIVDPASNQWVPVEATRNSGNVAETSTGSLSAAPAYTWDVLVNGFKQFRIRCTARTSGAQTWAVTQSRAIPDAVPVLQSHSVSGTVNNTPTTPSTNNYNSAATTNATSVKTSSANVYGVIASNVNAAARYLKLYNKASAPTVGTDTPMLVVPLPAASVTHLNFGALGVKFGTGLAFAITGAATDADTTAIAAGDVKTVISYL